MSFPFRDHEEIAQDLSRSISGLETRFCRQPIQNSQGIFKPLKSIIFFGDIFHAGGPSIFFTAVKETSLFIAFSFYCYAPNIAQLQLCILHYLYKDYSYIKTTYKNKILDSFIISDKSSLVHHIVVSNSSGLPWSSSFSLLAKFNVKFGIFGNMDQVFFDKHSYTMLTLHFLRAIYTGKDAHLLNQNL